MTAFSLQEEIAASKTRQAKALAAADEEYQRWYRDVEGRVREVSGGLIWHVKVKHVDTGARCFCGKATLAVGLCKPHYEMWWHGVNDGRNLIKRRIELTPEEHKRLVRSDVAKYRFRQRHGHVRDCYKRGVPLKCGHQYDPVRRAMRGWCQRCYDKRQWFKRKKGLYYTHPPGAPLFCGHDKKHFAKGCCRNCYVKHVWRTPSFFFTKVLKLVDAA